MDQSILLISLSAAIGVWIVIRSHNDKKFRISHEEAKKRLESTKDIVLLDVRTNEEYREKHIPKSISLPLSNLHAQVSKKIPDKSKEILVYCRSGSRSATAVRALSKLGYVNVRNMGGIMHWPYDTVSGKR